MTDTVFRYISPDPKANGDDIPESQFWQIRDILERSRFVLRRRTATEVRERAALILEKLAEYRADLEDIFSEVPEEDRPHFDDADDLDYLMLPDRAYPFARTIEDNFNGVPWAAETGWIEAEDHAVLAMTKVDAAVSQLIAGGDGSKVSAACCLLDAYRCCFCAIDCGGLLIQTEDELLETMQGRDENMDRLTSWQNTDAKKYRASERLKSAVFSAYQRLQSQQPDAKPYKIAKDITQLYEDGAPEFAEFANTITGDRFKRFYDWVLKFKKGQIPSPSQCPDDAESLLLQRPPKKYKR